MSTRVKEMESFARGWGRTELGMESDLPELPLDFSRGFGLMSSCVLGRSVWGKWSSPEFHSLNRRRQKLPKGQLFPDHSLVAHSTLAHLSPVVQGHCISHLKSSPPLKIHLPPSSWGPGTVDTVALCSKKEWVLSRAEYFPQTCKLRKLPGDTFPTHLCLRKP